MKNFIVMSLVLISLTKVYAAAPELKCMAMSTSNSEGTRNIELAFNQQASDDYAQYALPESFYEWSISNINFRVNTITYKANRVDVIMNMSDIDSNLPVQPTIGTERFIRVKKNQLVSFQRKYQDKVLSISCRRIK